MPTSHAPAARCPEVQAAVAASPAPPTKAALPADAAPSDAIKPEDAAKETHCSLTDQPDVDRAYLEKPVTLRPGVGNVSFKVTTRSAQAQAFFNQGLAYIHSYVWLEAARSFHQALRLDPTLAMAWWGLAKAELGMRQNEHAKAAIDRAKSLASNASPREQRYIDLLAEQRDAIFAPTEQLKKKHEALKASIDKALAEYPKDPELWVLRANVDTDAAGKGQGGNMASVAFYKAVLELEPRHLGAHHYLVHSYEMAGRYTDAMTHARIYASAAPNVPHAQHMLGHVLPRTGAWAEALTQFEKADQLHQTYERAENVRPGDDWHHSHNLDLLAFMYVRLGRYAEAESVFRRGLALPIYDTSWEGFHAPLIEFLLLRGRHAEALEQARQMAKRGTGSGPIVGHALAAEALLALGRRDEASAAAKAAAEALALTTQEKTRNARRLKEYFEDYVTQAQAEVDLWGPQPEQAEKALIRTLDWVTKSSSVDGWGVGLFLLERVATEAKRAGRTGLVTSLHEFMRRADPSYVPGTASGMIPGAAGKAAEAAHSPNAKAALLFGLD